MLMMMNDGDDDDALKVVMVVMTIRHVARATQPKPCGGARAQRGAQEGAKESPGGGSFRPGYRNC